MIRTIYLNIEDDVRSVSLRLKQTQVSEVLLVIPKGSYLFSDSINLRLLKKQVTLLQKKVYILTQDTVGKLYAKEAGFELKFFPSGSRPVAQRSPHVVQRPPVVNTPKPVIKMPAPAPAPVRVVTKPMPPRVPVHSTHPAPVSNTTIPSVPLPIKPLQNPKIAQSGPSVFGLREKYEKKQEKQVRVKKPRSVAKYIIASVLFLGAVGVCGILFLVIPKATITVYPRFDEIEQEFAFDTSSKVGDEQATLPSGSFDETVITSGTYDATGKKEVGSKASGMIKIFNYTGKPITLKASTTVLNVGTKKYVLAQDAIAIKAIPATVKSEAENDTPAVQVIAALGGEDYNLPASTRLEISNNTFGTKPTQLYAKVSTPFLGGNSRVVSVITKADLDKAKEDLLQKAIDNLKNDYLAKDKIIVDGGFIKDQVDFAADRAVGDEAPSTPARLKAKIRGLAVSKTALVTLSRKKISDRLNEIESLQTDSEDTFIPVGSQLDMLAQKMQVSLTYKTKSRKKFDPSTLPMSMKGLSRQDAVAYLENNPAIEKFEIVLSPSWQSRMPFFANKIVAREVSTN